MPRTLRELGLVIMTVMLISFVLTLLHALFPGAFLWTSAAPVIIALALGLSIGYAVMSWATPTDPWQMQARLMRISNQPTPTITQVNKHTVTYLALCMEELAETIQATRAPLTRLVGQYEVGDAYQRFYDSRWHQFPVESLVSTNTTLERAQLALAALSLSLRTDAQRIPDEFAVPLLDLEAVDMADGCTDLSVVAAGLSIASGVPGSACYNEVVGSNLSKADPSTGVIEKDATGKWIKGCDYKAPELFATLLKNKGNP